MGEFVESVGHCASSGRPPEDLISVPAAGGATLAAHVAARCVDTAERQRLSDYIRSTARRGIEAQACGDSLEI